MCLPKLKKRENRCMIPHQSCVHLTEYFGPPSESFLSLFSYFLSFTLFITAWFLCVKGLSFCVSTDAIAVQSNCVNALSFFSYTIEARDSFVNAKHSSNVTALVWSTCKQEKGSSREVLFLSSEGNVIQRVARETQLFVVRNLSQSIRVLLCILMLCTLLSFCCHHQSPFSSPFLPWLSFHPSSTSDDEFLAWRVISLDKRDSLPLNSCLIKSIHREIMTWENKRFLFSFLHPCFSLSDLLSFLSSLPYWWSSPTSSSSILWSLPLPPDSLVSASFWWCIPSFLSSTKVRMREDNNNKNNSNINRVVFRLALKLHFLFFVEESLQSLGHR